MCFPAAIAALGLGGAAGAGAATAAGATAAAATGATAGGFLSTLGTVISVGGSIAQAISGQNAAKQQAASLEAQMKTERDLAAVEEQRTRGRFRSAMRQQAAELAARGITLDSPTAVLLGETAASEMSFEAQKVRSGGQARQIELSAEKRMAQSRGLSSVLKGVFTAADTVLTAAPDLWPGIEERRFGRGVIS